MRNRKQPSCSRKQNGPRKRTGCATCKDAHVKCTEEKPECRRCERLSLSCQYEFKLLWEEDALQRNIVHGRSGVWSRHGRPPILPPTRVQVDVQESNHQPTGNSSSLGWHFISYNQQDFVDGVPFSLLDDHLEDNEAFVNLDKDGSNGLQDENQVSLVSPQQMLTRMTCALALGILEVGGAVSTGTSLTNWIPTKDGTMDETLVLPYPHSIPLIGFSSSDSQLFSYYVQELSPKCSLSSHRNPYLNVLLPVAYSFEPLRHTLLAAAACQLFHYSGNRHFELQSLRHRSKAMRGLNEHLGKEDMDWSSLATMVMFCFRDITDGCEPSWITHLKMGLRMLKRIRATIKADANLRSFCEIYFVAHDVMGRAAWEHDVSEMQHYEWEQDECYQEIDSIMGCSRELISLISEVSHLAGMSRSRTLPHEEIVGKASGLFTQLSSMDQILRRGEQDANMMIQIAEVKRLTAILYLHDGIIARLNSPSFMITPNHLHEAIITALRNIPSTNGSSLWPLFVLGKSCLHNTEDIAFVLDRLQQLEQSRYLGSVYHARKRIERNLAGRLTLGEQDMLQSRWEGEIPLNDNERWVSLA